LKRDSGGKYEWSNGTPGNEKQGVWDKGNPPSFSNSKLDMTSFSYNPLICFGVCGRKAIAKPTILLFVGPVSAVGKRVGPVIERSLVQKPDWTVTVF
jgi:hypothetical protein